MKSRILLSFHFEVLLFISVISSLPFRKTPGIYKALGLLNEIYQVQGLLQNYVYPVHKLVEKTRIGSRYIKKYDTPKTPAMRLLGDPNVNKGVKEEIQRVQKSINPVALALKVSNLQAQLIKHAEILDSAYPRGKGA